MPKLKQLAPADAFFLMIESDDTPSQVGCLARLKLPKGRNKTFILELVESFRKFQPVDAPYNLKLADRRPGSPVYHWETVDKVDIDYHLRHSALPQPGGERELAVLISRLHSIPLDHARPMWECHIIEGLADNTFAIYAKMHHALVDGVAASRMLDRWASQLKPEISDNFVPFWAMPLPKRKPKETVTDPASPAQLQNLVEQIANPLKSAAGVVGATVESIKGSRSKKMQGLVAPYSAPDSILNVPVGPQRRVSTIDFKIDRLKAIGKQRDGTLNDVVMAVCGGALRTYLSEQGALPNKPLISQVPVSFRPKEDQGGGNAIGAIMANLATQEADPLKRFDLVKQSMSAGKELLGSMNSAQITAYSALMTLPFAVGQITGIGNRRRRPMYNVVISNVPGPRDRRYLNGAELLVAHPVSFIMQGQALNITLFTYDDTITFIFTACRESLPSIQRLVPHTEAALEELEKAVGLKPPKAAAKKAAVKKAPAKKTPAKKTAAKKAAPKKAASKKAPVKKAAAKPAATKQVATKPAAKKTAAKKVAAKKVVAKKAAAPKKAPPKKVTASKAAPKKPAVKKVAAKKTATKAAAPRKKAPARKSTSS